MSGDEETIFQGACREVVSKDPAKFRRMFGRRRKIRTVTGTPWVQHLGLLFVGLKLAGIIAWPWPAVVLPYVIDMGMLWFWLRALDGIQRALYEVDK